MNFSQNVVEHFFSCGTLRLWGLQTYGDKMFTRSTKRLFIAATALSMMPIIAEAQSARQCRVVLELGPGAVSSKLYGACSARYIENKTRTPGTVVASVNPSPNGPGISVDVNGNSGSIASVNVSKDSGVGVSVGNSGGGTMVDVGIGRDAEGTVADVSVDDDGIGASVGDVADVSVDEGGIDVDVDVSDVGGLLD